MFRLIVLVSFLAISMAYVAEVKVKVNSRADSFTQIANSSTVKDNDSFVQIGNSSSYYLIEHNKRFNWFAAYHACRLLGSDLVALETLSELEAVAQYIIDLKLNGYTYWTSGIDLSKPGNHIWFSTGRSVNESLWSFGEPNNLKNIERCDELTFRPSQIPKFGLNDRECEQYHRYICEKL